MNREETIQIFKDRILAWERQDILDLANMLYDLHYCVTWDWDAGMDCWRETYEELEDYLNLAAMPSYDIPEDIASDIRVWAMDKKGNCLISLDFDSTNHGHFFGHMIKPVRQLQGKK